MKYVIVGAVAGGASTAARLRRLDESAEIVVFEKGQYMSYANCGLPYYIGDIIKERKSLFVQTATSFARRFNIDVRVNTEVTEIQPEAKTVTAVNILTGAKFTERYDKLVLSPGALPVRPIVPGVNSVGIFTLRNVEDTDQIKAYITKSNAKKAVIVGAGFVGLEMAENLHKRGLQVSIVEMNNQILTPVDVPMAAMAQRYLRKKGIDLYLNAKVEGFNKGDGSITVQLNDGSLLEANVVILSIGVRPDTRLAAHAGLKLGITGGISVNEFLQTSDPDIYAVGDAIEFKNPISGEAMVTSLAGPANKQGRICANNLVLGNKHRYHGSINTAIVKLFDITVGTAGMAVKDLERNGIPYASATIHGNSHAGYYPGSQLMTIQIAFSPTNGELFSAQVIGGEGADKRLDLLSTVIKNKATVYDLAEIEHAYAPPFSSAKDPVNMAGFVAENILLKRLNLFQCSELLNLHDDGILIDVRTPAEFEQGTIDGAVNIPLDEIRDRLAEIPTHRRLYIFCQQGMRGYLAQRILVQNGFSNVANLSGGYLLWKAYSDERSLTAPASQQPRHFPAALQGQLP